MKKEIKICLGFIAAIFTTPFFYKALEFIYRYPDNSKLSDNESLIIGITTIVFSFFILYFCANKLTEKN
jgi:uncharacterized membrane protein required for colicin V production